MTDSNEEKVVEGIEPTQNDSSEIQPEAEAEMSEEYRKMMAEMPPVEIYSLLQSFISMLVNQCWQWLGLVKNPVTGNLEKDLAQAKVAIDTVALLVTQLEPKLEPSEQRQMQAILSDLRMNFVRQSAK